MLPTAALRRMPTAGQRRLPFRMLPQGKTTMKATQEAINNLSSGSSFLDFVFLIFDVFSK
ncbi:unnamed protein product [Cuscuta epithymum]|uniref:Uncharacterized protein n=1 Tax=Cuscuta epithymum TaxID=186058 RepID=A0AAV0CQI8_9ASTE|nr:unnamed protein product [Cuscuta epithymum]